MKLDEAEARRIADELYKKATYAQNAYLRARDKFIVDGLEPVESLRVASDKAIAASGKAGAELLKYNTPPDLGEGWRA